MAGRKTRVRETSLIELIAKVHIFKSELWFFFDMMLSRRKNGVGLE